MAGKRKPRRAKPKTRGFRLRFKGGDVVSPGNVRLGELADLLLSLEAGVASIAGVDAAELGLSLMQVENRSAGYLILPREERGASALRAWSASVKEGAPPTLPEPARETTRKVVAFAKRHSCTGEMTASGERTPLARLTSETVVQWPYTSTVEGPSVLYGTALRVGGVSPKLWLRVDDRLVALDVASEPLARRIGEKLYTTIGVAGTARWNPATNAMTEFRVEELLPYEGTPTEALDKVAGLVGADLSALVDVEGAVESVRSLADL